MGKPLNKKFFGDPSGPGLQLSVDVWFTTTPVQESSVTGWIVRQRGTGIFEITDGSLTERFKLQDGAPSAEGQASMEVNPFGTTGVTATASATEETGSIDDPLTVDGGGSEYLTPPVVTITGAGNGAIAVATLTGDAVTSIAVTNGGAGYSEPSVSIAAPTGGDIEFVRTILSHGVKTFQGSVCNWDVVAATQDGQCDLPLS